MWRAVKNKIYAAFIVAMGVMALAVQPVFAATKVQTNICGDFLKPTIISPLTGFDTNDAAILVSGTAQPYLAVAVTVNGTLVGITMSAGDGTYAVQVPLSVGDNTLVASDGNGCGLTKDSDSVVVHRSEPTTPVAHEPTTPQIVTPTPSVEPTTSIAAALPHALDQPAVPTPTSPGYKTPTIRQPTANEAYTSSHVWVVGTAVSGSLVTIYVNDTSAAKVTASTNGSYAALVELRTGTNTLQVKSEKDGLSAFSQKISVVFNEVSPVAPAPSVGTVLAVAAVTTTTVAVGVGGVTWAFHKIRIRIKW